MKINLILNNEKVVVTPELVRDKIRQLFSLLKEEELSNQENFSTSNINNQVNNVVLLLCDMGYDLTAKEAQNIIKKDNPSGEKEHLVTNLYEALNFFLGNKKKLIHQNNINILYKIISNNMRDMKDNLFRITNEVQALSYSNRHFKILDFNSIPSLFDQLIEFINVDGESGELPAFLNMQIVHLHNLAMSPFSSYNAVLSKIISLWYLNLHNDIHNVDEFFQLYLETIHLHQKEFQIVAAQSIAGGDYTAFALFIVDKLSHFAHCKRKVKKIIRLIRKKKKLFLAPHESKFLFFVLYYELNQFDWKQFKKITQLVASKQYIMINLSKLDKKYDLLLSETIKNRKFFSQSRFLKFLLSTLSTEQINSQHNLGVTN